MDLVITLLLILCGYIFGNIAERRHFRSIIEREKELSDILCFSMKSPPEPCHSANPVLVVGNVVVSVDYFKRVAAGMRNLVGGRMSSYESLLERARREAILRMKQIARDKNAAAIINIKLETSSISKGHHRQIGSIEVCAYGTALMSF